MGNKYFEGVALGCFVIIFVVGFLTCVDYFSAWFSGQQYICASK